MNENDKYERDEYIREWYVNSMKFRLRLLLLKPGAVLFVWE